MNVFKEMHLTVYRRAADKLHSDGEGMVVVNAGDPLVGDTDPKKYSSEVGIQYLSFFMTLDEFVGLMEGRISGCNDIGHNVRAFGDSFTFFDMEFSREQRGVLRVPFVTIQIPRYVRRILLRAVRSTLRKCDPDGDRLRVELPLPLRERWARQYGCGTGKVEVDVGGSGAFFSECSAKGGETFSRSVEHLKQIALNGTARHTDLGKVHVSKDWDGFYFRIMSPSGRCTMNGGIINHGKGGEQSWSLHT